MPSDIEWTDETWNPTLGCSVASPGCTNCYAAGVAHRGMTEAHKGLTQMVDGRATFNGTVRCLPERLDIPLHWRKPRTVFVDSMSDLFHPEVPVPFIADVLATIEMTPQHTYQVLTKRPQRMAQVMAADVMWDLVMDRTDLGYVWPLPNLWLGTSIESDRYTFRADHLRATPAAVRFLSLEPLLGPLPSLDLTDIDWVIVGGESGPHARPTHRSWVRDIRDRCVDASVPFFYKQAGEWASYTDGELHCGRLTEHHPQTVMDRHGVVLDPDEPCDIEREPTLFLRVGKKAAGRTLDWRTWDEMPKVAGA